MHLILDIHFNCADRIISMGFPSEGVEANYRNPLPEVQRFFREKHPGGKIRIYNLCSEREYPPSKFEGIGTCTWYPFDDHNPVRAVTSPETRRAWHHALRFRRRRWLSSVPAWKICTTFCPRIQKMLWQFTAKQAR